MDTFLKKAKIFPRLTPTQIKNTAVNVGASSKTANALKELQGAGASLLRTGIEVVKAPEKIMKIFNSIAQYIQVFIVTCILAIIVGSIYSIILKRQKIRAISTATKATAAVVAYANVGGRQMMNKGLNTVKNMEEIVYGEVKKAQDRLEKLRDELLRLNVNRSNVNQAKLERLMDVAEKQYKDSLSRLGSVADMAVKSANLTLGGNAGARLIAGASLAASHILNEARQEQTNLNKPGIASRALNAGLAAATGGVSRRFTNRNNRRSATPRLLGQP